MPNDNRLYDLARLGDEADMDLKDWRFRTPADLVKWARGDLSMSCRAYTDIWHLDEHGQFQCCCFTHRPRSIHDWARDPAPLQKARESCAAIDGCAPNWVLFENREGERSGKPTRRDAEAFMAVREAMETVGVHLLDDLILHGSNGLSSLHDLVSPGQPYSLATDDSSRAELYRRWRTALD
jgi:hypothetical protein